MPLASGQLLYADSFTGTDADLITASGLVPYTTAKNTPTTIDLLSQQCRMKTTGVATTGYNDYAVAGVDVRELGTDLELYVEYQFVSASEQYIAMGMRRGLAGNSIQLNSPQDGFYVECDRLANSLLLNHAAAGSQSSVTSVAFTYASGTWYALRVLCIGSRVRVKTWALSTGEPSTWSLDTRTQLSFGRIGREYVSFGSLGGASNGIDALFDNFAVGSAGVVRRRRLSSAAATNVNAGHAGATGDAFAPTITKASNVSAGHAGAAGAALQPAALIAPSAGHAGAAGAAFAPTITRTGTAPAGLAAGTGQAFMPGVSASQPAGHAGATGDAYAPTIIRTANAPAGHAGATGAALGPTVTIAPNAGHAGAAGAAFGPSITRTGTPAAGHAGATGDAYPPSITRTGTPGAGHAGATGQAFAAKAAPSPTAGHAGAAGAGYPATISTASQASASAGHAGATGQAYPATPSAANSSPAGHAGAAGAGFPATISTAALTDVSAGHAGASGQAFGATCSVTAKAGHAGAAGDALAPTVTRVVVASAGHAGAAGAALQPGVSTTAKAGHAGAGGAGFPATASTVVAPADLDPVALASEDWAVTARVEAWAVSAVVEEAAMHAGDTAFPLRIRASFADADSGHLGTVLADPGITYTVTMELVGADRDTDTPPLVAQLMSVASSTADTITLDRSWVTGETDTPGRYSLVVVAHVGSDQFTLPSDGRRAELLIEP